MSVIDEVSAVLEQGPICDSCVGRVFADRSYGLTNAERGEAVRVTRALEFDEPYESFEEDCWVCEDYSMTVDEWGMWAINELSGIDFETYQVGTRVPPLIEENDRLLREEAGLDPEAGEPFKRELNREVGKVIGERLGVTVDFERPDVVVILALESDSLEVQINPAFVYGRYRKLVRGIPQTEWPCRECYGTGYRRGEPCDHCDGEGYLYENSVESYVAPVIRDGMEGSEATFHGAGREDVDALMLGTGRPFVVEVADPKWRFPDVNSLEIQINESADGKVEVERLVLATYEMVERVKELPANKTYRATIQVSDPVTCERFEEAYTALEGATIQQETPHRVSHRRAEKTREREVYEIDGELVDENTGIIEVRGEGGLYIKELLHGDDGRTQPSLAGLLGKEVEVVTLDVIAVDAEEGKFADPAFLRDPE